MSIKLETRTVFRCKCIQCGHEWDAVKKPKRCAKCKYLSWNGEDSRFSDRYDFKDKHYNKKKGRVPTSARFEVGAEAPSLPRPENTLEVLVKAKEIIERLIEDNPCDHPKMCSCDEKRVLAGMKRHINKLSKVLVGEEA